MPRHKSNVRSAIPGKDHVRRTIASLAARIMAEDGVTDYGFAKRKAARSVGARDGETLPSNEEVEVELRTYQSLFQEDEHPERLMELRAIALDAMEMLAEFHPYLKGAVLDGTASRYAGINIDLFANSTKDVEISLLSRNVAYQTSEPRRQTPGAPETHLHFDWHNAPVTLSVYPQTSERQQRRNSSVKLQRANANAVAALIAQQ